MIFSWTQLKIMTRKYCTNITASGGWRRIRVSRFFSWRSSVSNSIQFWIICSSLILPAGKVASRLGRRCKLLRQGSLILILTTSPQQCYLNTISLACIRLFLSINKHTKHNKSHVGAKKTQAKLHFNRQQPHAEPSSKRMTVWSHSPTQLLRSYVSWSDALEFKLLVVPACFRPSPWKA